MTCKQGGTSLTKDYQVNLARINVGFIRHFAAMLGCQGIPASWLRLAILYNATQQTVLNPSLPLTETFRETSQKSRSG
jgi:hypothetical protein